MGEFNFNNTPWFVRTNNPKEYELVSDWLKEQGLQFMYSAEWHSYIIGLSNFFDQYTGKINPCVHRVKSLHEVAGYNEIKFTFRNVLAIDSIEFPTVESERDKKIRELKETIDKAQEQIKQLEEMKYEQL